MAANNIEDQSKIVTSSEKQEGKQALKFRFQIGLTIGFSILATLLFLIIKMVLDFDVSNIFFPLLAYPLNILIVCVVYPKKLKIPFGETNAKGFLEKIGLSIPMGVIKYIFLGIIIGACSLTGMLIGSLLTGRFQFNLENLQLKQVIFATVPGFWEEVYFRGIMMIILLNRTKDWRKAMIFQSLIFTVLHIRGFDLWAFIDLFSVFLISLAFTYTANKTNSLLPGIIFHFLHDAFLFLFQVPEGIYVGAYENIVFFASLWIMIAIGCMITKIASEKLNISHSLVLYNVDKF